MPSQSVVLHSRKAGYLYLQSGDIRTCQSCQLKPGCGQYLIGSMQRPRQIVLPDTLLHEAPGTAVADGKHLELSISSASFLTMALLLYLVPVLVLLLGVLLAERMALSDTASALFAAGVLGVSLYSLRACIRKRYGPDKLHSCLRLRQYE